LFVFLKREARLMNQTRSTTTVPPAARNGTGAATDTPTPPAKPAAAVEPLLVPASVAGPMCGRSVASWWRDVSAGRCPAPVKLGGRTLWRVADLRLWVELGCPPRKEFEARMVAKKRS
jgi:predicted DNA-binding transcriptional regulator AlpA